VYYQNNQANFKKALLVAQKIRKKGGIVEVEVSGRGWEELLKYARSKGIKYILRIDNSPSKEVKKIETISEREEIITYE